jgi:hypothetical protein
VAIVEQQLEGFHGAVTSGLKRKVCDWLYDAL